MLRLAIIAAMDAHGLLANEQGIPWHLPTDIAHFRARAQDRWLLLGRRTYEEMQGWFKPGHIPLVLTRSAASLSGPGQIVTDVSQALALAASAGAEELLCCGGAQVFTAALSVADEMELTEIDHAFPPGFRPVYFPSWDRTQWRMIHQRYYPKDEESDQPCPMTIRTYVRHESTTPQTSSL